MFSCGFLISCFYSEKIFTLKTVHLRTNSQKFCKMFLNFFVILFLFSFAIIWYQIWARNKGHLQNEFSRRWILPVFTVIFEKDLYFCYAHLISKILIRFPEKFLTFVEIICQLLMLTCCASTCVILESRILKINYNQNIY